MGLSVLVILWLWVVSGCVMLSLFVVRLLCILLFCGICVSEYGIGLLLISRMCLLLVLILGMNFCVIIECVLLWFSILMIELRFMLFGFMWNMFILFILLSGFRIMLLCLVWNVCSCFVLCVMSVGVMNCGNLLIVSFFEWLWIDCVLLNMCVFVCLVSLSSYVDVMYFMLNGGFLCISIVLNDLRWCVLIGFVLN